MRAVWRIRSNESLGGGGGRDAGHDWFVGGNWKSIWEYFLFSS